MQKKLKLHLPSLSPYHQIVDKIIKRRLGFKTKKSVFKGLFLTDKKIGLLIKAMPNRERVYYLQKLNAQEIERLSESLIELVMHASLPKNIAREYLLQTIDRKLRGLFPNFRDNLTGTDHIYYNNVMVITRDWLRSVGHGKIGQRGLQKMAINFACTSRGQLVEVGALAEMKYATRQWIAKKDLIIGTYVLKLQDNLTLQLVRVLLPKLDVSSCNKKCAEILLREAMRTCLMQ